LLALGIVAGAGLPPAKADPVVDFYKGKAVTVVVSSNAAGGYDDIRARSPATWASTFRATRR
jgi:hypothetical protein